MLLREEIPSWGDFKLDTKGKYLGVYLGPGAASLSWEGPLKKYVSRCAYIASLKAGLATSALLYCSLAVASLSFVMQICPIPAEVLVQEARALRRLAPGPGNWIPISALHNLDTLFELPASFTSLSLWGLATRARVAISDLNDCAEQKILIAKALLNEDAPIEHRWRHWFHNSIAHTVARAKEQLVTMRLLPKMIHAASTINEKPHLGLQSALYKALRLKAAPADLHTLLRKRLERWSGRGLLSTPIGRAVRRGERIIQLIKGQVPSCVVAALVRTWFNGWCTPRRFQQGRGKCLLSDECTGDDSIEHYARCTWGWHTAKRRLRIEESPRNIGRFMLLEQSANDDPFLLAANLYAVYCTTNHFRALGRRGHGEEAFQLIAAAYTKASMLNQRLSRRIRSTRLR